MQTKNKILSGVASLGIGAFIAKLLGAIYRVPLTNIIGGSGLVLYQMVFPIYALLLDFSGAGVPSALSKIIASHGEEKRVQTARQYLKVSLRLFLPFGIICTFLMAFFSKSLAVLQGDGNAFYGYIFLSPAVLFVSLISCFRGYFQGLMNMSPTAKSQIIEQVVKLIFGLLLAYAFKNNVAFAVAGATFAITVSEAIALIWLYKTYRKDKKRYEMSFVFNKSQFFPQAKEVLKTTIPITLIGIMIPLSQVVDSFIIINVLSSYRTDATALYGLMSGVVMTVINLPVSICYGVATVAIPAVSGAKTHAEKIKNAVKTLLLTLLLSLPCAVVIGMFSQNAVNLLFRSLTPNEKTIAVNLLRLASPCVVLLSILQTANAVLIGKGKLYSPVLSLSVGVAVKTIINLTLIKIPEFNVYGGVISVIACYFTVCLINLIMIFKLKVSNGSKSTCRREYAS